uniref:Uncharacterized protein n=1 Tax=Rhizophora mucronata TaxID=61149 RepID=A0A2P2QSZ4_RHIMU
MTHNLAVVFDVEGILIHHKPGEKCYCYLLNQLWNYKRNK